MMKKIVTLFIPVILLTVIFNCCKNNTTAPATDLLVMAEIDAPGGPSNCMANVVLTSVLTGKPVSGASITINGTTVPETSTSGTYYIATISGVLGGTNVILEIKSSDGSVSFSSTMPPTAGTIETHIIGAAPGSMLTLTYG
jgi:hypothetical protein